MGAIGVMNVTRTLRASPAPDGAVAGIAAKGLVVEVLQAQGEFSRVRLVDVPGKPDGWVSSSAIDLGDPAPVVIDKADFARACWQEGSFIGVNPHYVSAIGELRSRVTNSADGKYRGVFRLSPEEWSDPAWDTDEFHFRFEAADISDWRKQTTMFSLMTLRAMAAFRQQPTALELYMAQLFGAAAAAKLQAAPDQNAPLDKVLGDADVAGTGQSLAQLLQRHRAVLELNGAVASVTGAREQVRAALKLALDSMRPLILREGPSVLEGPADAGETPPDHAGKLLPTLQKARAAFATLTKDGWTAAQACGIVANIHAESGFDPTSGSGDGGTAYGLCQWRGSRRTLFARRFSHAIEAPDVDPATKFREQLEFITFELRFGDTLEVVAGKELITKVTAGDAADSFCRRYERPLNEDRDAALRRDLANAYARLLGAAFT